MSGWLRRQLRFGTCCCALLITTNNSTLWAIIHRSLRWIYVIYFALRCGWPMNRTDDRMVTWSETAQISWTGTPVSDPNSRERLPRLYQRTGRCRETAYPHHDQIIVSEARLPQARFRSVDLDKGNFLPFVPVSRDQPTGTKLPRSDRWGWPGETCAIRAPFSNSTRSAG
jgi:hypothetical protein